MLTFINSKLPDDWKYLTSNITFSKKVNPMKYRIETYLLVRRWKLLFIHFTGASNETMKSILNVKKVSNLIKSKVYLVIISSLQSKVNKQNSHLPFADFFFRIPLLHFIKSFSTIQFHVCFQ